MFASLSFYVDPYVFLYVGTWFCAGRFFEVLSGTTPEPLWKIMSRIAVVYALEPIFTVIFVINMNKIWEKVMSVLRARIFRRMLIQKVALRILGH